MGWDGMVVVLGRRVGVDGWPTTTSQCVNASLRAWLAPVDSCWFACLLGRWRAGLLGRWRGAAAALALYARRCASPPQKFDALLGD